MHKTTLYLEDDVYERIRQIAATTGRTQAAVIREALQVYAPEGAKRPRSIGMGSSGRDDLSARAEDLLEGFGESE